MTESELPEPVPSEAESMVEDPLFRNSLREARWILALWACCFVYTVSYCYLYGYVTHEPHPASVGPAVGELFGPLESFNRRPDSLRYPLGLGIPDWVFYGIVLPWLVCIVLSFWYCLALYREDDLQIGCDPQEETVP